ncbi:hypothetical protein [Amycolatopsis cihanbeyliensis]|uniref:Uncharacterized protein n=1 Tax=Amycolatopsis cihanbeyliensis TaxID=1128664 RepID=A0A542DPV7_AMYCI|nr:hypothetical protein [Amycolatopsis cihanbeyliensis]TQJ05097.1 hypothetical protein FB471_4920 [Amycolatopsis cihanbeyliensis]
MGKSNWPLTLVGSSQSLERVSPVWRSRHDHDPGLVADTPVFNDTILNHGCDIITFMVNGHVERVRAAMLGLCEPMHDAFTYAEQRRRVLMAELDDESDYGWYATHTVRAFAYHRLRQLRDDLGGWALSGNHAQNGALWLTDGSYRVRMLHSPNGGVVPPPGSNEARRAFYCNPPLTGMITLFGDPNDRLLVLWRIDPKSAAPVFRVVRTIEEWKWGSHHQADLDFQLPATADELAHLAFEPTDEGLGLDLPLEEEGDLNAGGFTG